MGSRFSRRWMNGRWEYKCDRCQLFTETIIQSGASRQDLCGECWWKLYGDKEDAVADDKEPVVELSLSVEDLLMIEGAIRHTQWSYLVHLQVTDSYRRVSQTFEWQELERKIRKACDTIREATKDEQPTNIIGC